MAVTFLNSVGADMRVSFCAASGKSIRFGSVPGQEPGNRPEELLERNEVALALHETAASRIADAPREFHRFHQIHSHFAGRMSIGAEGNGHGKAMRELENFW